MFVRRISLITYFFIFSKSIFQMSMDFRDFEFALFIKDESTPEEELHNRSELYQGNFIVFFNYLDETCNLYILMRRKNKTDISTDWRLSIQTIHVMIFLV